MSADGASRRYGYFVVEPEEPPSAPPLLPPTPVLPEVPPEVPVPEVLGLVVLGLVVLLLPVPDVPVLLPPVVLLPLLPRRSWRWQSSFAIPVSTSQRLDPELLEPLVLGLALELELPVVSVLLGLELLPLAPVLLLPLAPVLLPLAPVLLLPVLLLSLLGLELELLLLGLELEPLVLGLVVEELPPRLGLEVELPADPPTLLPLLPLDPEVWAMETLATPRNAAATAAQSTLVFISAPKGIGEMLPPTCKQLLCPLAPARSCGDERLSSRYFISDGFDSHGPETRQAVVAQPQAAVALSPGSDADATRQDIPASAT